MGDLSLLGRQQLRGDGGRQNILQHGGQARGAPPLLVGHISHQMAHQRLGDACVHGVHGHVVPVIRRPAQGQLAQVPGADDQAAGLVGQVHQDLRALPCLPVLEGDGEILHGLADVLEMELHGGADVDLPEAGPDLLRQDLGVGLRPLGGAEAGHGDGQNIGLGTAQQLHGPCRDEQRQGRVQSAGQTHHCGFGLGVGQPFFQAQRRQSQDLPAPGRPVPVVGGNEGIGGDGAGEPGLRALQFKVIWIQVGGVRRVGRHALPLVGQLLQVDLGDGQARCKAPLG